MRAISLTSAEPVSFSRTLFQGVSNILLARGTGSDYFAIRRKSKQSQLKETVHFHTSKQYDILTQNITKLTFAVVETTCIF
jgi:hypothetical protein